MWLTEPQWPLSSGWDKRPMMFIGQIELNPQLFPTPNVPDSRMAYLFVTHAQNMEEGFFDPDIIDPDGGENAIIIQPEGEILVDTAPLANGPTLWDDNGGSYEGIPQLQEAQDPEFLPCESYISLTKNEQNAYSDEVDGDKIGGVPYFFQGDGWPDDSNNWRLLLQLHANFKPFCLQVGASPTIFAFVNEDLTTGKLVIQDC
ncbi:DUF1963 domain-containing protein [Paenibacillus sp. KN14-4R]|uniref:DUF1963 domain-containing protein n=1 Tax=Paenibacillus sp. KN14-4R TaxID=3445773 RepID=UPI003FA0E77E